MSWKQLGYAYILWKLLRNVGFTSKEGIFSEVSQEYVAWLGKEMLMSFHLFCLFSSWYGETRTSLELCICFSY